MPPGASSPPLPPFAIVRRLARADRDAIRELVDRVTAARGHPAVDDHRLEQALGGEAPGLLAALAWDDRHHRLLGYVQAVRTTDAWDIDVAVPDGAVPGGAVPGPSGPEGSATPPAATLAGRLLQAVRDGLATEDDTQLRLWRFGAGPGDDRLAAAAGFRRSREICQLRRPLPVEPGRRMLPSVATRPFVVGQDEPAWLAVNNAAFAWHPEQGDWTAATLAQREREPWFDPAGFLLHEVDGRLAGFCWTKVHRDVDPPLGEIYVIAVDPAFHGRGLGRALVLAGLDHLADRGLTVGMLYVEASNLPALRLYEDLGFTTHHVDRVYTFH